MAKLKKDKTSKYKYVHKVLKQGKYVKWRAMGNVDNRTWCKDFDDERAAALCVDVKLIECGRNPVNILKKK